jgi:hypothetical protein
VSNNSDLGNGLTGSENLIIEHRKRLQDPLRMQKENFEQWNIEDFELMK